MNLCLRCFCISAISLASACSLTKGDPTFRKPSIADVAATYHVTKVGLLTPDRTNLKKVEIKIFKNGHYQLRNMPLKPASRLLPKSSGTWSLVETSGIDVASGLSWGIGFKGSDGSTVDAYCLNRQPPYKLMFFDRSKRGDFGDALIFEKLSP